ncbi:hypothetical protein MP228_001483 [Amoeboaphelidium protococcarum]|nr:hypothetical protein MP228_001483 [Amoeboaphelidium protococcarum]
MTPGYSSIPLDKVQSGPVMSPLSDLEMQEDFDYITQDGGGGEGRYNRKRSFVDKINTYMTSRKIMNFPVRVVGSIVLVIFALILIGVLASQNRQPPAGTPNDQSGNQDGDVTGDINAYNEAYLKKQYPNRISFTDAIYSQFNLASQLPDYNWLVIGGDDTEQNSALRQKYSDGSYFILDAESNVCVNHISAYNTTSPNLCQSKLVNASKLIDPIFGTFLAERIDLSSVQLSASGRYLMFLTDSMARWRRSKYSRYWLFRLEDETLNEVLPPLYELSDNNRNNHLISAKLSLWKDFVAFVFRNDIYVLDINFHFDVNRRDGYWRVTDDGSYGSSKDSSEPVIYNGIADWVYEEEVFTTPDAFWFAPQSYIGSSDSTGNGGSNMTLAFLKFDDTNVKTNTMLHFMYGIPKTGTDHYAAESQYSYLESIKYPKPGRNTNKNPKVTLHLFQFDITSVHERQGHLFRVDYNEVSKINDMDKVVYSVQWSVTDPVHQKVPELFVRLTDRYQDNEEWLKLHSFAVSSSSSWSGSVISNSSKSMGWFETDPGLYFIPQTPLYVKQTLNLHQQSQSSYVHLQLFNSNQSVPNDQAQFLSQGPWEVTSKVLGHKMQNGSINVLFQGTNNKNGEATERYIYSSQFSLINDTSPNTFNVSSDVKITRLIGQDQPSWNDASVSPGGRFVILNYKGPGQPRQSVLDLNTQSLIESYQAKSTQLSRLSLPAAKLIKVPVISSSKNGTKIELNAKLYYPLGYEQSLNSSVKFPLLVTGYWGPNSQKVDQKWSVGFNQYLASKWHYGTIDAETRVVLNQKLSTGGNNTQLLNKLEMALLAQQQPPVAVLVIDVRGSGFRGSAFRDVVTGKLGAIESQDVIAATKYFVKSNTWIDQQKVAIWGWSYGGFMSTKVIQNQPYADPVFSAAVAVAPVTNWKYYDSIYTERYMKDTQKNFDGYSQSRININDNFNNVKFLAIHGSADDNVDVQNTMTLQSAIQSYNVRNTSSPASDRMTPDMLSFNNYRVQIISDDNHSMQLTPRAYETVMKAVLDWIIDAFKEIDFARKSLA